MLRLNPLDRRYAHVHRLMSLLAEALLVAEVEAVLVVSEPLVKKGMIPHESVTLEEGGASLFSDALLVT